MRSQQELTHRAGLRSNRARLARRQQAGFSALELSFSVGIFVVVLLSSLAMVDRDAYLSRSSLSIGTVETLAQEMLFELEKELVNAAGETPRVTLDAALNSGVSGLMSVDSTANFPPDSTLIVDWNNGAREVIAYESFTADQENFVGLTRGQECTPESDHDFQANAIWGGMGFIAAQQIPAPVVFGQQALELEGPMWFTGHGTGFVYRVPVDPTNPMNGAMFLSGDDIMWGAPLDDATDPRDCYAALYYEPRTQINEATSSSDINRDGDMEDVFDIGQIRRVVWDATDPDAPVQDLGLGPSSVVQERCNYGSDLDGDGFGDPIFLWDPGSRRLHMRVLVIGASVADIPIVRMVESIVYLRNAPPTST